MVITPLVAELATAFAPAVMPSSLDLSPADIRPAALPVATVVDALAFQAAFSVSLTKRFEASCAMIAGGCEAG
ncbi:hypothetical protein D3C81_2262040 [compost metagenome]